jgi:hypothetical protein
MNDRLERILRGRSHAERFIVTGLALLLGDAKLDQALDEMSEKPLDLTSRVAGQPFSHWYGKNKSDLEAAVERGEITDDQLKEIEAAHKDRGVTLHKNDDDALKAVGSGKNPSPGRKAAATRSTRKSTSTETGGDANDDEDNGGEPTIAGRPLSEYDNRTDEELLEMENVGEATVTKIREAQKARDKNK